MNTKRWKLLSLEKPPAQVPLLIMYAGGGVAESYWSEGYLWTGSVRVLDKSVAWMLAPEPRDIVLSAAFAKKIIGWLGNHLDEGPPGEGWQSVELDKAIRELEEAINEG